MDINSCLKVIDSQGIDGHKVIDEYMVNFRYFTSEESIEDCCLVEWIGHDRSNFGGGFIADENELLAAIKQVIDKDKDG